MEEGSSKKRKAEDGASGKKRKKQKKSKPIPITKIPKPTIFEQSSTSSSNSEKKKLSKAQKKKFHQKLITQFHTLIKQLENAKLQSDANAITSIEKEIEKLGGLKLYQKMSIRGEKIHSNYNTSKWITKQLLEYKIKSSDSKKLKLLDVGALDFHYKQKWIDALAIDLHSNNPQVMEKDFFQLQKDGLEGPYDVICLSLVINFVGDPKKRGEMLRKSTEMLKQSGHLFIVLPLPCVENSRYFNQEILVEMMESLGCKLITNHNSKKLAHFMFKKEGEEIEKEFKKENIRNGVNRNNFFILLE